MRRVIVVASLNSWLSCPSVPSGLRAHRRPREISSDHGDAQVAKLSGSYRSRRLGHGVAPLLGLGKRDHLADGLLASHDGHEAVEAEGDPAHGRRTELQGIQQEPELRPGLLLADPQALDRKSVV